MKTHPLCLAVLLAAAGAQAHVTLEQPKAAAGSSYKATLRVGHGCSGSPTHTLSVSIPDGVRGAKPMPKAGWTITIRPVRSDRSGDPPAQISWTANSRDHWLDDAHYDEFVLQLQLPAQPGTLSFQVAQLCAQGRQDWSAPLQVLPAAEATAHH